MDQCPFEIVRLLFWPNFKYIFPICWTLRLHVGLFEVGNFNSLFYFIHAHEITLVGIN